MSEAKSLARWFDDLLASSDDKREAQQYAYLKIEQMETALPKVTLHKYQCTRGCQIARVVQIGSTIMCAVRDYEFSPGLNAQLSVPAARRKNTMDGDKHWPGHVYDVQELAEWGDQAGMQMVCRHFRGTVLASDLLKAIEGARPGHPNAPTRLR